MAPPVVESTELSDRRVPVVFVPGVTGVGLRDEARGKVVWGKGQNLIRPHDRGYQTSRSVTDEHPGPAIVPDGVLLNLRLFGLFRYRIYQQLVDFFSGNGFVLGDLTSPHPKGDFFLFSYDWRQDNVASAKRLAEQLGRLRLARGEETLEVDLICQSNGAHICRYFARFGALDLEDAESGVGRTPADLSVRKLVLVGSSNGGSIRVLRELNRGRRYVKVIGRTISPETLFTFESLYQDLPVYSTDLFVDERGEVMDVDLWKVESWKRYQWSIFAPQVQRRLRQSDVPPWFGTDTEREDFLQSVLNRASRFHRVLASESTAPLSTCYSLISNMSRDTPSRAVLTQQQGLWETSFAGDKAVQRDPDLSKEVVGAGDGHATAASLKWLSSQETGRLGSRIFEAEGTHRRIILEEAVHRRILGILADQCRSGG